jgi:hypothetical protein
MWIVNVLNFITEVYKLAMEEITDVTTDFGWFVCVCV